jgi:hypothetical protein
MAIFKRGGNFALNRLSKTRETADAPERAATRKGVALKTVYFAGLTIISALLSYFLLFNALEAGTLDTGLLAGLIIGSIVVSFIASIVCMFSVKSVP